MFSNPIPRDHVCLHHNQNQKHQKNRRCLAVAVTVQTNKMVTIAHPTES
jgi:hypothetical protein